MAMFFTAFSAKLTRLFHVDVCKWCMGGGIFKINAMKFQQQNININ